MKFMQRLTFGGRAAVLLPVIVIALVSFAVYLNALSNDFASDDQPQVVENPWIRDISNIPRIFTSNVWRFTDKSAISNYYRPLMHTVYLFTYQLFGLKPWGFHLVNLLFHAGNSVLVFILITRLLGDSRKGVKDETNGESFSALSSTSTSTFLSPLFLAALLFATHPVHTEAVAWIAGVPELSYTLFYLLSLNFYIRFRNGSKTGYLLSVISFALATLCKEPALTLPIILIAYDYCFKKEGGQLHNRIKAYIPYFFVSLCYLVMRLYALGGFTPMEPHVRLSVYGYVINVFPLFAEYMEKLLLPVNLNAFHVLHPVSSLLEVKAVLSLVITAAFVAFSFLSAKKNKTLFFGFLLIVMPLLPALYIPALGENVFAERYLYLPSAGLMILVAAGLERATMIRSMPGLALHLIILLTLGLYSAATISRNAVWKDDYTLFKDSLEKSPDAAIMHYDMGNVYVKRGELDEAAKEYQTSIKLRPYFDKSHNNLGNIYKAYGRIDEAVAEYEMAVRINPYNAETYNNLGVGYAYQGRGDESVAAFKTALALNPDFLEARRNLEIVSRNSR